MTPHNQEIQRERLIVQNRISELSQVPAWIEDLGLRHGIPASTQFAMNLCLEETLSNIIQHGYSPQSDQIIAIQFASFGDERFTFVVEDQAPPFNPVDAPELPKISAVPDGVVGGQGLRLLRRFADSLEYQELPKGNRLTIGFSAVKSALAKD